MMPSPNDEKAWENYMYKKSIETYDGLCEDMGVGDMVDENGDATTPSTWYWRGCSKEMNEDVV